MADHRRRAREFLNHLDETERAFVHVSVVDLQAAILEAQADALDSAANMAEQRTLDKTLGTTCRRWAQSYRDRIDLVHQRAQMRKEST